MKHSYSDMLTYLRCPKKYEYSAIRNLQPKAGAVPLTRGILFHQQLMGHYLGNREAVLAEQEQALYDAPLINDEVLEYEDLFNEATQMVDRYLEYYRDEEWEVLHVEETFTIELDGAEITFTPDLVIRDSRGVWAVDHKTTSRMPSGKVPVGNFQALLYSAALREIYPDFRGFIFNFMRNKVPTQPRLTKTAPLRIADVNRIDTTFEILRDYIITYAPDLMDDPATRRRLAELKDNNRFFWREYVFVTDEMADNILDDTSAVVSHIEMAMMMGRYPRSFLPYAGAQECENCAFRDLCVAELRGYDTEPVLLRFQERDMSHKNYDYIDQELL